MIAIGLASQQGVWLTLDRKPSRDSDKHVAKITHCKQVSGTTLNIKITIQPVMTRLLAGDEVTEPIRAGPLLAAGKLISV